MPRRVSMIVCVLFVLGFGLSLGCGGGSSTPTSGPSEKQLEKEKMKGGQTDRPGEKDRTKGR